MHICELIDHLNTMRAQLGDLHVLVATSSSMPLADSREIEDVAFIKSAGESAPVAVLYANTGNS